MAFRKQNRVERIWKASLLLHGTPCGSRALGVRVCDTVLTRLGLETPEPNRLVCVTESDGCCVDALQVGLGCTMGKGHLLFYKTGMLVFTVYDLTGGGSVRLRTRGEVAERIHEMNPRELLSMPESALFTLEEARPMTPRVLRRVTTACNARGEQIPPRVPGLQDCPDTFRQFDEPK